MFSFWVKRPNRRFDPMLRFFRRTPPVNVLLLDGESLFTPKVVRSLAQNKRWRMHVLARVAWEDEQPTLAWSRHLKSFHMTEIGTDEDIYLDAIRRVVAETGAAIIVPVVEGTVRFCIRHRAALEKIARIAPVCADEAMFATAIDKGLLGAFMARHGIPHPRTCLVSELATAGLQYPLLVKPRRGWGGDGMVKVDTPAALRRELATRADPADLCVQEYIEGEDRGCSVLVQDGEIRAWTTQRGVSRVGTYSPHTEIQMDASKPVHDVAARLMRALNFSGIAHLDLRIDARTGQPLVLEINGRYWNSLWASTATRVNFPDLSCRLALGEPLPAVKKLTGRFVQPGALRKDLLRLRPRIFRFRWNGLSMILSDPLPEAVRYVSRFWKRQPHRA